MYAAPAGFDPHLFNDLTTHTVAANLFEGLVALDREMQVVPALAASWTSPDERTWRFDLRAGAVFHDGRPLEAAGRKAVDAAARWSIPKRPRSARNVVDT